MDSELDVCHTKFLFKNFTRVVSEAPSFVWVVEVSTNVPIFTTLLQIPNLFSRLKYSFRVSKCMALNDLIPIVFSISEYVEKNMVI